MRHPLEVFAAGAARETAVDGAAAEPTTMAEKMRAAATWLRLNEGGGGEAEDCHAVAAWLDQEADRRDRAAVVRGVAKRAGVSAALVRRALAARNL